MCSLLSRASFYSINITKVDKVFQRPSHQDGKDLNLHDFISEIQLRKKSMIVINFGKIGPQMSLSVASKSYC